MGNINATVHPTKADEKADHKVSELYSQHEISGTVVIERNNNSKKSKCKSYQNPTVFTTDKQKLLELTRQVEARQKEHENQVNNLTNQLKERTNRIEQLQQTLLSKDSCADEEKKDFDKISTDLKRELNLKSKKLLQQQDQLKIAQKLVDKSNLAVEGLTIVIQNFINQVSVGVL